jgi:hypothetical protein
MIGERKKFSKTLHSRHDPKSRSVVKEYLARRGIKVHDNPDKFGVDLIAEDGTLQVEVEHRLIWEGPDFPFSEINVPERKAKFFVENSVAYFILSRDYTHIGMIDGKTLMKYLIDENLKESPNKYVRENEYFYKVPITAFTWEKI